MNEIFSSRVFAAKFERSRKLSVEMGSEEKNGWEGRAEGDGRLCGCRVIRALRRTVLRRRSVMGELRRYGSKRTSQIWVKPLHPRQRLAGVLAQRTDAPVVLEGRVALAVHRVHQAAERVHV